MNLYVKWLFPYLAAVVGHGLGVVAGRRGDDALALLDISNSCNSVGFPNLIQFSPTCSSGSMRRVYLAPLSLKLPVYCM